MHELACDPKKWREWWPTGSPLEVDVSTLPAAGAITQPTRLTPALGDGPWLGIWGNYAGLRIGFSPAESFQCMSPCAVAYPEGCDIYLSADSAGGTLGGGIASFARFRTRESALAFGGMRPSYGSRTGVTRWDQALGSSAAFGQNVISLNEVLDDITGLSAPLRQPDSVRKRNSIALALSLTSTGIKGSIVAVQKGTIVSAFIAITTATNSAANIEVNLEKVSGGNTERLGQAMIGTGTQARSILCVDGGVSQTFLGAVVGPASVRNNGAEYIAGDTIQLTVNAAASVAGAADFHIYLHEDRALFE